MLVDWSSLLSRRVAATTSRTLLYLKNIDSSALYSGLNTCVLYLGTSSIYDRIWKAGPNGLVSAVISKRRVAARECMVGFCLR